MNSDYNDLLQLFNEAGVRYLVVGGYAVIEYTEPRYTKDLDLWIATDGDNAGRVYRALAAFGAPMADLTPADFSEPETFFQIGIAPVRVDVLTSVTGIEFHAAWERREVRKLEGVDVPFISVDDLITAKTAAGRRQDRADAAALRRAQRASRRPRN